MLQSHVSPFWIRLVPSADRFTAAHGKRLAHGAGIVVVALLAAAVMVLSHSGVAQAQCDNTITVFDTTSLNYAISAFNAQMWPCHFEIGLTNNISMTAAITPILNPNPDVKLEIDGNGYTIDGGNAYQLFIVNPSTTVEIHDLIATQSNGPDIFSGGQITLTNVSAINVSASGTTMPVGIFNYAGSALIQGGEVSGNAFVGVVSASGATTIISGTLVSNNAMSGVYNDEYSRLTLAGATVSGNQQFGVWNANVATITDSTITGTITITSTDFVSTETNSAIWSSGTLTIESSSVISNSGAGIRQARGQIVLANSTVSGNQGVGYNSGGGQATILNSTLAANQIALVAYSSPARIEVLNSILADSFGSSFDCALGATGVSLDVSNSLIERSSATCPAPGGTANLTGVDPLLGPLQDNGGSTWTRDLQGGSPAINAGSNGLIEGAGLTTDQRGPGFPRIVGGSVDMGAIELQDYTLTITPVGNGSGTVTSDPAGINCSAACTAHFAIGTVVTLTATASGDSVFAGWSGGGCDSAGVECVVTMDGPRNVMPQFMRMLPPPVARLSVTRSGSGAGTVTSVPAGINCGATCDGAFMVGGVVTLTASAGTGSVFTGWSGACSGKGTCVLTMSGPLTATASFEPSHPLTVTKAGSGTGTVTSVPAGINCGTTCNAQFLAGTVVTLTASADSGSTFAGWSGACGGKGTCAVTMTAAKTVTATFALQPPAQHTLSVTRAGNGTGKVTSSPAGIDCGADCEMPIISGTVVTLTATTDAVTTFGGWSGGSCQKNPVCVVTVTGNTIITARFETYKANLPIALRQDAK